MTDRMHVVLSPATQAVQDRPSRSLERLGHLIEAVERHNRRPKPPHMITIIILQIIDTPRSKALRILRLPVQRARIPRASHLPGAGVHAEQQILVVQFVRHGQHPIGKLLLVDDEVAVVAAAA